ncbi:hypothetical protein KBZ08_14120 [Cyanobium sp. Candia 9D4]|uniref:hypothetical protein n=1 Tax=Cyanobium sp. Candia 9D4 TaxID=2823707 RepID=UPI0020CEA020|nr:hypothetical protein [Cyanobium sp. Candia 9D4]MCP9935046.1 hypothetical protein [Cyanobium sp. Candia 9D4]
MKTSAELDEFLIGLGANGISSEGLATVEGYIRSCWDKGVEIVLDPSLQGAYGTYNPESNTLTIGAPALSDNIQLIETFEHEFIHVLQDEIDGLSNSSMSPLGLPVNAEGFQAVSAANITSDPRIQALELEAHSAEHALDNPENTLMRAACPIEQQLAVSYAAEGLDPLEASLQASLDAPLLESFFG